MFSHLMTVVLNRQITVSDNNEGPVVNIAAVRFWRSRFESWNCEYSCFRNDSKQLSILSTIWYENHWLTNLLVARNDFHGFLRLHTHRLQMEGFAKVECWWFSDHGSDGTVILLTWVALGWCWRQVFVIVHTMDISLMVANGLGRPQSTLNIETIKSFERVWTALSMQPRFWRY